MTENSEKLKEIFSTMLGVETAEITNESTNNDLGMDSLDKVELVMEIEKQFDISIPFEKEEALNCFLDYVNVVEELTTKNG
jgi:acyl carrier protein